MKKLILISALLFSFNVWGQSVDSGLLLFQFLPLILILGSIYLIIKVIRRPSHKSIEEIQREIKDKVKKINQGSSETIPEDQPKFDKYGNEIEYDENGSAKICWLNSEIEVTRSQIETMFVNAMEVTEGGRKIVSGKGEDEFVNGEYITGPVEIAFLFWIDRLKESGEFEGFLFPDATQNASTEDEDNYIGMFFQAVWRMLTDNNNDTWNLKNIYYEYKKDTANIDKTVDKFSESLKNTEVITENNEILFLNWESHIPILEGSSDGPESGKKYVRGWADDKQEALKKMEGHSNALEYASDSLKADKEVVLAAVGASGHALEYASDSLKADKEVVLAAVGASGHALEYASDSLKADKEVVRKAMSSTNGYAYNDADDSLKADKEIVAEALELSDLKEAHYILGEIPESIEGYRELMLKYVKKNNDLFSCVGSSLEDDQEFLEIVGDDSFRAFLTRREEERAEEDMENESAAIEDEEEVIEIK